MASPAGVTADTPGAPPKAPTKEKGRREAGKTAVRPRIVRSVLLAILGAGSGVSVLLGGFYDVTVWGPIALGVLALALALVVTGAGRPRLLPGLAVGSLAFLWLFSRVGTPHDEAFALSILFIALGIVGNLPGAIYYLRGTPPERRLGGAGDAITP